MKNLNLKELYYPTAISNMIKEQIWKVWKTVWQQYFCLCFSLFCSMAIFLLQPLFVLAKVCFLDFPICTRWYFLCPNLWDSIIVADYMCFQLPKSWLSSFIPCQSQSNTTGISMLSSFCNNDTHFLSPSIAIQRFSYNFNLSLSAKYIPSFLEFIFVQTLHTITITLCTAVFSLHSKYDSSIDDRNTFLFCLK